MASTVGFAARNLPPPTAPFVETSRNLSDTGYWFLLKLLTAATATLATNTINATVAATGSTQANAAQLSNQWNVINSSPAGGGVLLSVYQPGQAQTVFNESGQTISVYPPPGTKIDTSAVNIAYSLTNGKMQVFSTVSSSQIYSMQLG